MLETALLGGDEPREDLRYATQRQLLHGEPTLPINLRPPSTQQVGQGARLDGEPALPISLL